MILRYSISQDDEIKFPIYHLEHSAGFKKSLVINRILGTILVLLTLNLFLSLGSVATLLVAMTWGAVCIFWPKYNRRYISALVKEAGDEYKLEESYCEHELSLREKTVREAFGYNVVETKYDNLMKIASAPEHFFLYTGTMSGFIVPLSAFASEAAKGEFLALLRQRCKSCEFV